MTAPAVQPTSLGEIGGYVLLDRIGGNSTSTVYRALDAAQREVALKMIAADFEDDEEARERFYREATVTAALSHPQIVAVLEVGDDAGRPFIVMELLDGEPLDAYRLRRSPLGIGEALRLTIELCDGLQAAHHRDIVHRDIKPSNLFVTTEGRLKILDFGLARLQASTLTAHGQVVGTPDFMAPEQAQGRKVDHRADLFSAGAVAAFLVSGISPFQRPTLRLTLEALLGGSPAGLDLPHVAPAIRQALLVALAADPEARFQTAAAMADALRRAAAEAIDSEAATTSAATVIA
jgi:serine/threonine protein kinase